jgi:hypothetical protein
VDITAANQGDATFTFELLGVEHGIDAGKSATVTIPLQEDQAYDFTITAPNGYEKRFTGVLDCRTQSDAGGTVTQTLSEPSPATVGGTAVDTNLAETGGSGITPMITVLALGLVGIGATTLVLLRDRKPGQG